MRVHLSGTNINVFTWRHCFLSVFFWGVLVKSAKPLCTREASARLTDKFKRLNECHLIVCCRLLTPYVISYPSENVTSSTSIKPNRYPYMLHTSTVSLIVHTVHMFRTCIDTLHTAFASYILPQLGGFQLSFSSDCDVEKRDADTSIWHVSIPIHDILSYYEELYWSRVWYE